MLLKKERKLITISYTPSSSCKINQTPVFFIDVILIANYVFKKTTLVLLIHKKMNSLFGIFDWSIRGIHRARDKIWLWFSHLKEVWRAPMTCLNEDWNLKSLLSRLKHILEYVKNLPRLPNHVNCFKIIFSNQI